MYRKGDIVKETKNDSQRKWHIIKKQFEGYVLEDDGNFPTYSYIAEDDEGNIEKFRIDEITRVREY